MENNKLNNQWQKNISDLYLSKADIMDDNLFSSMFYIMNVISNFIFGFFLSFWINFYKGENGSIIPFIILMFFGIGCIFLAFTFFANADAPNIFFVSRWMMIFDGFLFFVLCVLLFLIYIFQSVMLIYNPNFKLMVYFITVLFFLLSFGTTISFRDSTTQSKMLLTWVTIMLTITTVYAISVAGLSFTPATGG